MDRKQVENVYLANGITDFKLRNTEDLLKIHGIDYMKVNGYDSLDELNQRLYKKAIINLMNACGLENRALFNPTGIYFVEDYDLVAKETLDQDYYNVCGGRVWQIDKSGQKKLLHRWTDRKYKDLKAEKSQPQRYLRIEYKEGKRKSWLHITNEDTWY